MRFLAALGMTAQSFRQFFKVDNDLKKTENLRRHYRESGNLLANVISTAGRNLFSTLDSHS